MRFFARWPLTLLLALATIVLSLVGYYGLLPAAERPNPLDWLIDTMSLFEMSWHWKAATPAPWPLQVARFTAAVFTLSALGKVWMKFFGDQVKQYRLSRWNSHVVICGLGRKGLQLAMEFRDRANRVVIAEINPDEDDARLCRKRGILLEGGDAAKDAILDAVGIERARYVLAVCRDDHTNLEIAMETLARFRAAGRTDRLDCYVHLVNLPLRVLLQRHDLLKSCPAGFELRFFNIYENSARALFAANPPEKSTIHGGERVHLIIVGMTRLGEAMATQAGRIGHYRDLRPIRLTVIDEQAEASAEQFLARQPGLAEVCELRFLSMRLSERRFTRFEFLESGAAERRTVVLCLDRDEANVSLALTLSEHSGDPMPLLASVGERRGLAKLLSASAKELESKGIQIFGAVAEVCGWDLLRDEELDVLAKAFASFYQKRYGGPAWPDLSEDLRGSNRAAADHIDVKLRAIQCRRVAARDCPERFAFTSDEVEMLSRMEHARWSADRRLNGWVFGEGRDNDLKIHSDLISWEELTEAARDKDREQVLAIPAVLEQLGQVIQRVTPDLAKPIH